MRSSIRPSPSPGFASVQHFSVEAVRRSSLSLFLHAARLAAASPTRQQYQTATTGCPHPSRPARPASRPWPTATSLTDPRLLRHRGPRRTSDTPTTQSTTMRMQQRQSGRCAIGAATRRTCLEFREFTLLTPPTSSTKAASLTALPTTACRRRGEEVSVRRVRRGQRGGRGAGVRRHGARTASPSCTWSIRLSRMRTDS